jgi:hypothetical protein
MRIFIKISVKKKAKKATEFVIYIFLYYILSDYENVLEIIVSKF